MDPCTCQFCTGSYAPREVFDPEELEVEDEE